MPPRRGRDRLRRVLVNEEAASALKFQVPPIPQPGFFPPMILKAFQAYTNFWYAQAQVEQGQYLVPLVTTPAQPLA